MSEIPQDSVTPRNSPLREVFKNPFNAGVDLIEKHFPDATANDITDAGLLGVKAVALATVLLPKHSRALVIPHTIFNMMDGLDGNKAERDAQRNGTTTTAEGAIYDAVSDKKGEFASSLSLAMLAWRRGDNVTATLQTLAGITSIWPAIERADAEADGNVVKEGFVGSRVGRAVLNGVSLFASENVPVSRGLATLSLSSNVINAAKRSQAKGHKPKFVIGKVKDAQKRIDAGRRHQALVELSHKTATVGAAALAVQAGTAVIKHKATSKKAA